MRLFQHAFGVLPHKIMYFTGIFIFKMPGDLSQRNLPIDSNKYVIYP